MENETNDTRLTQETPSSEEAVLTDEEIAGKVYNTDSTDVDLDSYTEEVLCGKQKSLRGLIMTVILLAAGILAVLVFWLIRYKDLFL